MKILVTGSSGHLGEALVRTLATRHHEIIGLDVTPSPFTSHVGSIVDRVFVERCMQGVDTVIHTATLHKPHLMTHSREEFVATNITGTLNLLEAAAAVNVSAFVYTSTTSVFGDALVPPSGAAAAWITEDVVPVPKNIYGITKCAAENLCELIHRERNLPCLVLRTSRFFPEIDDNPVKRRRHEDQNLKVNEFLHRRVDLQDVVDAHLLAVERASNIGFGRFIVSATTPFALEDLVELRKNATAVVMRRVPRFAQEYERRGWAMFSDIDRVYVNERARRELGWRPRYDFDHVLTLLESGADFLSPLARVVGSKGYHSERFVDGPYPVQ